MWKGSGFKSLLALVLMSGLLVSCQVPSNLVKTDRQPGEPKKEQEKIKRELEQNLNEVETAYKNFKQSRVQFINELQKAIEDKETRQTFTSSKVEQDLRNLRDTNDNLSQKLNNLGGASETKNLSSNINTIIEEISSKVIEPLNEGLKLDNGKSEIVGKVQDNIGLSKTLSDEEKKKFGTKTQTEIKKFLIDKSSTLESQIQQIKSGIKLIGSPSTSNAQLSSDPEFQKLKKKVSLLEEKYQNLKIISIIALLLAIISFIGRFFNISKRRGNKLLVEGEYKKIEDKILEQIDRQIENKLPIFDGKINLLISQKLQLFNQQSKSITTQGDSSTSSSIQTPQVASTWHQNTPTSIIESTRTNSNINSALKVPQCVEIYNRNPRSLSNLATVVNETEESINQRRLGNSQKIVVEIKNGGNYWILKEGIFEYLVPKGNLKINEYNYQTVAALFECHRYRANYDRFQLVKPAKVSSLSVGKSWELAELGILEFY